MAPKNPWGTTQMTPTASGSSYPGLQPVTANETVHKQQYEEIQQDELLALASIYGEDFQSIETKGSAWKVRSTVTF
jgi:translation initiation factor 2-alpha kinase 4